jgi:hypothetical protein
VTLARNEISILDTESGTVATTVTLSPARRLSVERDTTVLERDVNGTLYPKDVPYAGPKKITIEFYLTSLSLEAMNNLWDFWRRRTRVTVTDGAATASPDKTTDAYFKTWSGIITFISPECMSPQKSGEGPFTLEVEVDSYTYLTMP